MTIKFNPSFFVLAAVTAIAMTGCGPTENDHVPTTAEVKAADANRQASVDKMNLPPEVKAQMKSHMGGPPVQSRGGPPPGASAGN